MVNSAKRSACDNFIWEKPGLLFQKNSNNFLNFAGRDQHLIQSNLQHEHQTRVTRMQHECNTSDTNATRKPHECHTSATQVRCEYYANDTGVTRALHQQHESNTSENITTQVKTYFHTPIFTIRQVKDYKERKNFILRIAFWKCLVLMPKCFLKVYDKN